MLTTIFYCIENAKFCASKIAFEAKSLFYILERKQFNVENRVCSGLKKIEDKKLQVRIIFQIKKNLKN